MVNTSPLIFLRPFPNSNEDERKNTAKINDKNDMPMCCLTVVCGKAYED